MRRQMPRLLMLLAVFLLMGMTTVSFAADKAKGPLDDTAITTAVKAKLAADMQFRTITTIEVNTTNGVVTLAGEVKSKELKELAGKLAAQVEGVNKVNNNLQVK